VIRNLDVTPFAWILKNLLYGFERFTRAIGQDKNIDLTRAPSWPSTSFRQKARGSTDPQPRSLRRSLRLTCGPLQNESIFHGLNPFKQRRGQKLWSRRSPCRTTPRVANHKKPIWGIAFRSRSWHGRSTPFIWNQKVALAIISVAVHAAECLPAVQ
jgi:hypothetical protein